MRGYHNASGQAAEGNALKLVEVATRVLTRRQFEVWYLSDIEMIEPTEIARRLSIAVATVYSTAFQARHKLSDHAGDIEDPDARLAYLISIRRGHNVEIAEDSTVKAVIYRQDRDKFVNSG